jgi:cyclophilin family peptidyl-prolyl cis-trans isomerase
MQLAALVLLFAQAAPSAAGPAATPPPATARPTVALDIAQGGKSLGTIVVALDGDKVPVTVENFLAYVRAGHYDGTIFHRVISDFMIQGGNLTPEMTPRPTRAAILNESKNARRNARGTIAMARLSDPNSATDQFFINLKHNHALDWGIRGVGYTAFGEVTEGMGVVDRIAWTPTTSRRPYENVPKVPVVITRARELTAAPEAKAGEPEAKAPEPVTPAAPALKAEPEAAAPAAPEP